MDFMRNGAPSDNHAIFLIGRDNGTSHYSLQSSGKKLALRRLDGTSYTVLGSEDFVTKANQWYHMTMTFKGNTITCTATKADGTGTVSFSYTDTDASAPTCGAAGIHARPKKAGWAPKFDNFKITMDNTVVFEDDFTLAQNQTSDQYLAAGKTGSIAKKTGWLKEGGNLVVDSSLPSINLVSAVGGSTNYALDWADYAVDANILLAKDQAQAGLIANSNGTDYYELRLDQNGVALYLVNGSTSTLLAKKEKAFALEE